jgi:hypothetical protein
MRVRSEYITNPGAGTFNIAVTMSASVPGFSMRALSFTGSTGVPQDPLSTIGSVTTSTLTFTTGEGNLVLTGIAKQDPSTSEPSLNSPNSTLWYDTDFGSTGNGAHFKIAVSLATSLVFTTAVNYSWTSAANHAFAGTVIK